MSPKLQTTLTDLPFEGSNPTSNFIHIIHDLLSPIECHILIQSHQNLVPSNVTKDTIRLREQFDDDALSKKLWERLETFYGEDRVKDEEGNWWKSTGLNERFRLCRYDKGKFVQIAQLQHLTISRRQILTPLRWKTDGRSGQPVFYDRQHISQHRS